MCMGHRRHPVARRQSPLEWWRCTCTRPVMLLLLMVLVEVVVHAERESEVGGPATYTTPLCRILTVSVSVSPLNTAAPGQR